MNHRQRPQSRKSSSTPPPAHSIYSYPPATMSNPSLGQHSKYPFGHSRPQQPRRHSALHPRRPSAYSDYSPNYASSSTALSSDGASASSTPKALKVLSSVKRSFSMNATKKSGPSSSFVTTSTAEETAAAQIRLYDSDTSRPPPTVQQIAAGLVTGLRSRPRAPPPSRSSLKKSTTSSTSTSSSTSLASTSLMSTRTGSTTTAATSVASSRRRFSLKDALFFGRSGTPMAPITTATRKAVRFHVDRSPNGELAPLPS